MALELKQQVKLTQQLVMTPQLQQAIKLLLLSRMELVGLVQKELQENPVLEESLEGDDDRAGDIEVSAAQLADATEATALMTPEPGGGIRDGGKRDGRIERDAHPWWSPV